MAIVFVFSFHLDWVAGCTVVSLVADYFDGMAARFTNQQTGIGKELDSLADVISFGLVPASIIYTMLWQYHEIAGKTNIELYLLSAPAFLIVLFSALRLAKFNLDTRQSETFLGLPTPASGIFVIGILSVFIHNSFGLNRYIFQPMFLYSIIPMLCWLMVAEIPMFSFKFKSFGWKENEIRYGFIVFSLALMLTLNFVAIPLIIVSYILLSLILNTIKK